jgi:hypothetical protein
MEFIVQTLLEFSWNVNLFQFKYVRYRIYNIVSHTIFIFRERTFSFYGYSFIQVL